MSESPSFVSQPQVIDLKKLFMDVRAGHIQIPRFQRPFVWDDERRVELLRSLRAGIPIGSLLVWRTSQNRMRCFRSIAGISIPEASGSVVSYLLDGHQRLTTLLAAFNRPSSSGGVPDDETPEPIFFDLLGKDSDKPGDFVIGNPRKAWTHLPLYLLLDPVALRQRFREQERVGGHSPAKLDEMQSVAEEVLYAMQSCQIPIVPLTTDDLDLATRTFHRVNSQGVEMTEVHMVSALTFGASFDLRETFEHAWEAQVLPARWEPAGDQQTLNVLKGILGMEITRTTGMLLVKRIREQPELAKRAVRLLARAMTEASAFVATPVAIPYQMQLTLTAVALDKLADTAPADTEWLRRWWGLTTTWGSFSGAATHRVQAALRHLSAGIVGRPEPWPELLFRNTAALPLPNLEHRNARVRAFSDRYARASNAVELLHERGSRALVSLAPDEGRRPGNRFLWPSERLTELRDHLDARDAGLGVHFVDDECLDSWARGEVRRFIERREMLMNVSEGEWFAGLNSIEFVEGPDPIF